MRPIWIGAAVAGIAAQIGIAHGADRREPRPEIFSKLVNCRTISADAERLACYDAQVSAIDTAEQKQDLVVVDRTQIRKARKSLFGLSLPNLSIFGDDDEKQEGFSEIETTISRAYRNGEGKWVVILPDGARWVQIDTKSLVSDPAAGKAIRIRKAAMGSFFANIGGQTAMRMHRVN